MTGIQGFEGLGGSKRGSETGSKKVKKGVKKGGDRGYVESRKNLTFDAGEQAESIWNQEIGSGGIWDEIRGYY